MSASTYLILQSGFISVTSVGFTRDRDKKDIMVSGILNKDYLKPDNNGYYNNHISKLYNLSINRTNLNSDFDFITDVITSAIKCFGTPDIKMWFEAQNRYASLTSSHKMFMEEMLSSVATYSDKFRTLAPEVNKSSINEVVKRQIVNDKKGYVPALQLQQWPRFINYSEKFVGKNKINLNKYFTKDTEIKDTSDFISTICLLDNSIQDLLTRLYIIFGDRNSIINVSN